MLTPSISIKKDVPYPFIYLPWYHSPMMQKNIYFFTRQVGTCRYVSRTAYICQVRSDLICKYENNLTSVLIMNRGERPHAYHCISMFHLEPDGIQARRWNVALYYIWQLFIWHLITSTWIVDALIRLIWSLVTIHIWMNEWQLKRWQKIAKRGSTH